MGEKLGQLWGIGVGPGDPELITVKALNCLQRCPVVTFPAGRNGRLGMAQTIVAPWLNSEQMQVPLWFPYVQDATTLETAWQTAATQVGQYLRQGQDVVFATEGDASFYSTFTYLAEAVQQQQPQVQIHTVPGVCSPLAAAAALGQPLTVQQQRLTILPAMHTLDALETALDQAEVVVLMKVAAVYEPVWAILQKRELLSQSRVIAHVSSPNQLIYDNLGNHPQLSLPYFSLLIVHCRPSHPLG